MKKTSVGRRAGVAAVLAAGLATAAIGRGSAADTAWYGIALPEARIAAAEQQKEKVANSNTYAVWDVPLSSRPNGEGLAAQPELDGEELLKDVRALVDFSYGSRDRGDVLWGRMIGSQAEKDAIAHVEKRFREIGLDEVWTDWFDIADGGRLTKYDLIIEGDEAHGKGSADILMPNAHPNAAQQFTPMAGELVWVGNGHASDLVGKDLKGKIGVFKSYPMPSWGGHTAYSTPAALAKAGAAGGIMIMQTDQPLKVVPLWGARPQKFGLAQIDRVSGGFLEQLLSRADAPVRARLEIDGERLTNQKSANVYGLLKGTSDEYVVLTAHTDAFYAGAVDNASGVANMLAQATYFNREGRKPLKRNLLFVATSGHHLFSPGVLHMIQTKREILERTAFVVNAEHLGGKNLYADNASEAWATADFPYYLSVTSRAPALVDAVGTAISDQGLVIRRITTHTAGGDPKRFFHSGVPVVDLLGTFTHYHSTLDTPENLNEESLEHAALAIAQLIESTDALSWDELAKGGVERPPLGDGSLPPGYIP